MRYPNAYGGVSKIFAAEIFAIIGAIVTLVGIAATIGGSVVVNTLSVVPELSDDAITSTGGFVGVMIIASIMTLIGAILLIFCYILNLVGLNQAGQDDPLFRMAFLVAITILILTIVGAVIGAITGNNNFSSSLDTVSTVANLAIMLMVIGGVRRFALEFNDTVVDSLGRNIEIMITIMLIVSIVVGFIVVAAPGAAMALAIIAGVIKIVSYICYLVFLARGRKMLSQ